MGNPEGSAPLLFLHVAYNSAANLSAPHGFFSDLKRRYDAGIASQFQSLRLRPSCSEQARRLLLDGSNVLIEYTSRTRSERDNLVDTAKRVRGGAYIVRMAMHTDPDTLVARALQLDTRSPEDMSAYELSKLRHELIDTTGLFKRVDWPSSDEPHLNLDGAQPSEDLLEEVNEYVESLRRRDPIMTYDGRHESRQLRRERSLY
jgi:predicted kinase